MARIKTIALFLFLVTGLSVISQNITPERKISICEGYLKPEQALSLIENKENIQFSYNPKLFNIKNEIYICKRNKSLIEVISYILGSPVELIIKDNYVIIKPSQTKDTQKRTSKVVKINGIIENGINESPIDGAIIETSGYKFTSNEAGFFSFKVNQSIDSLVLFINKEYYIGFKTTVPAENQTIKIKLYSNSEVDYTYMPSSIKDKNSKIENYWLTSIVLNEEQSELNRNRRVLLERKYQFSVIPSIGKYNSQSGMYRFRRSYNILAGYTGEIYGHELGLGVNIVRYDMTGLQVSGVANIVGGETSGIQISGGANICIGNVKGMQLSTTANTCWGNYKGAQVTSGVNLVKSKFRGFQLAPVNIVIDTLLGCQMGVINIVSAPANGTQFSAILNYNSTNNKLQYSIFSNIAKENLASQIGLINISGDTSNFQLGLLNFADTVSSVSIGFLSFVKHGYTHMDLNLNTNRFAGLKFKTGTNKFYNIITAKVRPDDESDFGFGYGFGSNFRLWKFISLSTDFTCSHVFENNTLNTNINLLGNLDLLLNFSIAPRFTLFAGFEANILFTNNLNQDGTEFYSTIPATNLWFDKTYTNQRTYLWPEITIGIRI
jgi:hypothetical protein